MTAAPHAAPVRRHRIPVEPATAAALEPFGRLIGGPEAGPGRPLDYYNGAMLPFGWVGADDFAASVARLKRRPPEVRWIERHFKHTQVFLPLGGRAFTAVVAPPSEGELPPLDAIRAFRFDGSAGFLMHVGTWHEFPFPEEDDTDIVVLLRGETVRDLKNVVGTEASGGDLDKKDLQARLGLVVEFGA